MEDKKRVYCISNLVDGLTKYKVYEVEYIHHGQTVYYDIINDNGVKSTHNANDFVDTKQVVIKGEKSYFQILSSMSREDKDLIKIAKEINDESIIKVVYIPADIDYYIQSGECSFAETVVEKHRRWS